MTNVQNVILCLHQMLNAFKYPMLMFVHHRRAHNNNRRFHLLYNFSSNFSENIFQISSRFKYDFHKSMDHCTKCKFPLSFGIVRKRDDIIGYGYC